MMLIKTVREFVINCFGTSGQRIAILIKKIIWNIGMMKA